MGILHTNKIGSTEMAKALGISLSKLQSLQKKNKFTFIYFMVNFINYNSFFCNKFSANK